MADSSFTDARVIELSRSFVNVIANGDTGHGEDKKLCKLYRTIPCSVHQRGMYAGRNFFPGNVSTPVTVFADPAGKELFRKQGALNASALAKHLQEALARISGEKIPLPSWKLHRDGQAALENGEFKKAIESFSRIKSKRLKDDDLGRVSQKGEALLKEALELPADEKKAALKKIADEFKPLEVSKRALEALK
jgi:hypothetical protein